MEISSGDRKFALNMVCCVMGLLLAGHARADVIFNVNSILDQIDDDVSDGQCHTSANTCTLRAAIMQANHVAGQITTRIKLPAGNYVLTRAGVGTNGEATGDLNLTTPMTLDQPIVIEGASAATSVIDANQIDRVMSIAPGRVATLSKIAVRGGMAVSSLGGGINNFGTLTLLDSIVEANTALSGGAGISSEGILDIQRSIIRSNTGGRIQL